MTLKQVLSLLFNTQMIRITAAVRSNTGGACTHTVMYVGLKKNLGKKCPYLNAEVNGIYPTTLGQNQAISIALKEIIAQ